MQSQGSIKKDRDPRMFVAQLQAVAEHVRAERGEAYKACGCIEFHVGDKSYYLIPLAKKLDVSFSYELLTQNEQGFFVRVPYEVLDNHGGEIA